MRVLRWLLIALVLSASLVQAQTAPVVLSSTTCPGTGCTEILVNGYGTVGIQITGTFSGTLTFEQTIAGTWRPLKVAEVNTPSSQVTTTTTAGLFTGSVSATRVRVRFSAHSSGSATITAVRTQARNGSSGGGSGNPFDQDLNTTDSPTFANLTVGGTSVAGASRWIGPVKVNVFAFQQFEDNVAGDVSGGTFTATIGGQTTSALAWNVSAANFKTALEALSSVGSGNVRSVVGSDVNSGYIVSFTGTIATELLTGDSTNLTGPSAPYDVHALGYTGSYPLVTLAAGDVLEDAMWQRQTGYNPATVTLWFTDWDTGNEVKPAEEWDTSGNGIGNNFEAFAVGGGGAFTNFYGTGGGAQADQMTISGLQVVTAGLNAGDPASALVPVVANGTVVIYASFDGISAPVAGEVWIWVKVSTPASP